MDEDEVNERRIAALRQVLEERCAGAEFIDDDINKLVDEGFTTVAALEAASKDSLDAVLPRRPGVVDVLVKVFGQLAGPIARFGNIDHRLAELNFESFDSVPISLTEVNLLTQLLQRPLVRKVPIYGAPDMVSWYGEIFEASKDEVAPTVLHFFRTCLRGLVLDLGRGEVIASTYWNSVFLLMEKIENDELNLPISTYGDTKDISASINHSKKRRDLFIILNGKPGTGGVPVLLADHKDKSLGEAKNALIDKHHGSIASVYGDLGYLLGYAAGDNKVQFYILPVCKNVASAALHRELDLRQRANRITFAIAVTNILRWMHSLFKLKMLCNTGIAFLMDT